MLEQCLVGKFVDPGLVAAQVNRHAVRHFVIQRLEYPLARSHRVARLHCLWIVTAPPLEPVFQIFELGPLGVDVDAKEA